MHFFTSQFYTKLANEGTDSVTSWTAKKDMDIFTKKFIFIPVNQSLNPGAIMNQVLPPNDDAPLSCLFFFDSLRAYRKAKNNECSKLAECRMEKTHKAKEGTKESPFDENTMDVFSPRGEQLVYNHLTSYSSIILTYILFQCHIKKMVGILESMSAAMVLVSMLYFFVVMLLPMPTLVIRDILFVH